MNLSGYPQWTYGNGPNRGPGSAQCINHGPSIFTGEPYTQQVNSLANSGVRYPADWFSGVTASSPTALVWQYHGQEDCDTVDHNHGFYADYDQVSRQGLSAYAGTVGSSGAVRKRSSNADRVIQHNEPLRCCRC